MVRQGKQELRRVFAGKQRAIMLVCKVNQIRRGLDRKNDSSGAGLDGRRRKRVSVYALAREGDENRIGLNLARIDNAPFANAILVTGLALHIAHALNVLDCDFYHACSFASRYSSRLLYRCHAPLWCRPCVNAGANSAAQLL